MPRPHAPVLLPDNAGGQGLGGLVFLTLFAALAVLSCFKYLALHSTVADFGRILSDCYSIHNANQWWRAFADGAEPLLPAFALVYRLVPDQAAPFVLLSFQALVLALPVLWVARRHGLLAALGCALFFPVWTIALCGFHPQALLVPLLFGFLAAARAERIGLALGLGLTPLLIGDYQALTTVCCGLYLYTIHGRRRAGLFLMLAGGLVFFVLCRWIVPFCSVDAAPAWPDWPGPARLGTLLASPHAWFNLAACFGALLFFPLFRPKLLLPALPSLALTFASGPDGAWTSTATAGATGVLLFAFCEVLGPFRILARQSGVGAGRFGATTLASLALAHILLAPSPASRLFFSDASFAFGMDAYAPTARDAAILAEILRIVPDDPAVPVASQNTLNWGALAERRHFGPFPQGTFEPQPVRDLSRVGWNDFWTFVRTGRNPVPVRFWLAQYVVLDTTRPWCLGVRCCPERNGACANDRLARDYTDLVARARREMDAIYDQGGFCILRRRPPIPAVIPPPTPAPAPTSQVPPAPQTPAASQVPAAPQASTAPQAPQVSPAPTASQASQAPPAPQASTAPQGPAAPAAKKAPRPEPAQPATPRKSP